MTTTDKTKFGENLPLTLTDAEQHLTLTSVEVVRQLLSKFDGQFVIQVNYLDKDGWGTWLELGKFPFRIDMGSRRKMGGCDIPEGMAKELAVSNGRTLTTTLQEKITTLNNGEYDDVQFKYEDEPTLTY